jgi:hypothetical protein
VRNETSWLTAAEEDIVGGVREINAKVEDPPGIKKNNRV